MKAAEFSQIEARMHSIESQFVEGTFSWLKDALEYKIWFKATSTPFLCVSGPQGAGKTYFTYHCFRRIQETRSAHHQQQDATIAQQSVSVAYFFFDASESQSLQKALSNIIFQIASQDAKFCESLVKDIDALDKRRPAAKGEKQDMYDVNVLWKTFLSPKFEKKTETSRLVYILLDGVDQLKEDDYQTLMNHLRDLNSNKTGIQIMMTGSQRKLKDMNLKPQEIDLHRRSRKEGDIQRIIDYRIKRSEHLESILNNEGRRQIYDHFNSHPEGNYDP
jgi:Cdc6-like AAA superfamily ATPase